MARVKPYAFVGTPESVFVYLLLKSVGILVKQYGAVSNCSIQIEKNNENVF